MEKRNSILISYDVRNDKRWRKLHKLLLGYGKSLQYSVFICKLNKRQLSRLKWEMSLILNDEDSLMICEICPRCSKRIIQKGKKIIELEEYLNEKTVII